jgi:hypothetical protein
MGLGNDEEEDNNKIVDEGNKSFGSVSCSICLEVVTDNGDRSFAKLLCGHQFHLGNYSFLFFLMHANLLELMLNGFQVLNGIIEICFLFYYRYCV